MKRAGGWLLGAIVVLAMGGGLFVGFRRILFRETRGILLAGAPGPARDAMEQGLRFALAERDFRGGDYRVDLLVNSDYIWLWAPIPPSTQIEPVSDREDLLALVGVDNPPINTTHSGAAALWCSSAHSESEETKPRYCQLASLEQQGRAAARWAKREGKSRTFILREKFSPESAVVCETFEAEARLLGMTFQATESTFNPQPSLPQEVLDAKPDLVFFSGEGPPHERIQEICSELRDRGCAGPLLIADIAEEDPALFSTSSAIDGALLITPFSPPPPAFSSSFLAATGKTADARTYLGYLAGRQFLDALGRPGAHDRLGLRNALDTFPDYGPSGGSTRPCALYRLKNGAFEFVELLP